MTLESTLKLLEFVGSFAWTDLKVQQKERDLVMRIAGRFGLSAAQIRQVEAWLAKPPRADEIDPADVPKAHRQMFLDAAFANGATAPATPRTRPSCTSSAFRRRDRGELAGSA